MRAVFIRSVPDAAAHRAGAWTVKTLTGASGLPVGRLLTEQRWRWLAANWQSLSGRNGLNRGRSPARMSLPARPPQRAFFASHVGARTGRPEPKIVTMAGTENTIRIEVLRYRPEQDQKPVPQPIRFRSATTRPCWRACSTSRMILTGP